MPILSRFREAIHAGIRADRRNKWRVALGMFLVYLLFRAWYARNAPYVQVDWAFQSSDEFFDWLRGLARRELVVWMLSFGLGVLTPPAWWPFAELSEQRQGSWILATWGAWTVFGLTTIALCFTIAWNEIPPLGSLFLPLVCYLTGLHLSAAAARGRRPLAWAAGQLGILALLILVGGFILARMSIAHSPLDFENRRMSSDLKRQLAERIRATRQDDGRPRQLELKDAEINALLNAALGGGNTRNKASVHFEPSMFSANASLALPRRSGQGRFVNVRVTGHVSVEDGHLRLGIRDLELGRVKVPRLLLRVVSSSLHAMLMDDPQIHRIIEAILSLDTQAGEVRFVFRPGSVSRQVVPSLAQLLWQRPDVAQETRIYLDELTAIYERLPADSDRFGKLMQGAFTLAQRRSANRDPVLENRAAIFALAILLGHPDLEPFVGELFDPQLRARAERMVGSVALRGRADWPRHFLVSAALVLLSNEATSDRIGTLKEQLDSQQGGSGFSFGDVLANSAGTRFAIAATRDRTGARETQARLARGFDVDAFFPSAEGLPEDIPAAEFRRQYGGIGGPGYVKVMDEIIRRLDALSRMEIVFP